MISLPYDFTGLFLRIGIPSSAARCYAFSAVTHDYIDDIIFSLLNYFLTPNSIIENKRPYFSLLFIMGISG